MQHAFELHERNWFPSKSYSIEISNSINKLESRIHDTLNGTHHGRYIINSGLVYDAENRIQFNWCDWIVGINAIQWDSWKMCTETFYYCCLRGEFCMWMCSHCVCIVYRFAELTVGGIIPGVTFICSTNWCRCCSWLIDRLAYTICNRISHNICVHSGVLERFSRNWRRIDCRCILLERKHLREDTDIVSVWMKWIPFLLEWNDRITFNVDLFHMEWLTVLVSCLALVIAGIARSRPVDG